MTRPRGFGGGPPAPDGSGCAADLADTESAGADLLVAGSDGNARASGKLTQRVRDTFGVWHHGTYEPRSIAPSRGSVSDRSWAVPEDAALTY
jgi:hypothetical protein